MMCKFLNPTKNPSQKKFIAVFRGSYKTTVLIGFVIYMLTWALIHGEPLSICYNTATTENAENFMADVRTTIQECKLYHRIFPDGLPSQPKEYGRFTQTRIEYRTEKSNIKFHVASLDVKQVSRHYIIIINDDLVNDANAFSDKERKSIMRKWRFQKSIITRHAKDKIGLEIDVGTPYHSKDLISHIIRMKSGGPDAYDRFVIPYAFPLNGVLNLDEKIGILTFPERFQWKDYQLLRLEQGASIFGTQYELKCPEESDELCKEEWVLFWTELPENYIRYMVIDPAGTQNQDENCPTGIIICDINESGTIFLVHAREYWLTPRQLIDQMTDLKKEFDPDEIYVEKEKYSITIADTMEHLAPLLNFAFVTHDNKKKPERIMRLKQWFETGRILFQKDTMNRLIDHAVTYPECDYLDMLDALAYVLKVMIPPKRGLKRNRVRDEAQDKFEAELEKIKLIQNRGRMNYDHVF